MTKGRIIRLTLKRIRQILISIFIFVWLVVALINTTPVQSFLAAKASEYFSKQWKTTVRIGALSITPFINVGIKDVYVEDLHKDTLLYAKYIEANLAEIPSGKHIKVANVILDNAVCHLVRENDDFNFQFIINFFASDKKKEKKPSEPLVLEVKDICLNDIDFSLIDKDSSKPIEKGTFAANRIVCYDINMKAKDFYMKSIDMKLNILEMSLKERCGIALNNLKGKVKLSPKGIELHDAILQTGDSFMDFDATMATTSFHTYSSFIDSVYCTLNIRDGTCINLKDACYWTERVKNADRLVYLDCDVQGTISNMLVRRMDIRTLNTRLNVMGSVRGLTDIDNTVFDLKIKDITSSISDYNNMNWGTMVPNIALPEILNRLGNFNIMGNFLGTINDFTSNLAIITDLGLLDINAQATLLAENLTKYSADISSSRIDVGKLLDNSLLGNTTITARAELIGTDSKTMQGILLASLKDCYFKGNNYDNIDLQGNINGYNINALAKIKDELVDFDGSCTINYEGKPTINFDAAVANLDLNKMNVMSFSDSTATISAKMQGDIQDFDIDRLNCDITLSDIFVKTLKEDYKVKNINLAAKSSDSINDISLKSDIIDLKLDGKYTFASLSSDVDYIMKQYIPDLSSLTNDTSSFQKNKHIKKKKEITNQDYTTLSDIVFSVNVKNIELVRSLFDLNLYLPKPINLSGKINTDTVFECNIYADNIIFSNMDILGANIGLLTQDKTLQLNVDVNEFAFSDSLAFKDILLKSKIDSSDINLWATLMKKDDYSTNASIEMNSVIDKNGFQGSFNNTFFNILGNRIKLNDNHIICIADKHISIMNLIVSSSQSKIIVDGLVSDKDALKCQFDNVDLSLLNPFIASLGIKLNGILSKDVIVKNILQSPTFTSNLEIDSLSFNDVFLGKAWMNVDNNISADIFNTNIKFLYQAKNKDIVPLQIVGTVAPNEKQQQLDLNLSMQNFSIAIIKTFISSFASDAEGDLSCNNVKIKGKIASPDLQGTIHCNNVGLKVNMLNTKFWLNDDISINNNKILFKDFKLKDAQAHKITVNGNLAHYNFSSFDINLKAVADKIKILDTKAGSGEMYYGTVYASANVDIVGDSNIINIYGNAKTESGTSLTVPVTSKENASEKDFITFVNYNQKEDSGSVSSYQREKNKSVGYNINLDLNVNPNARLYLPMDFTQLKGNLAAMGNGDLKIAMNSDGKFSMIGAVAIDNGTFAFNIMDVMEKKFILQKGGTLTWNGDPAGGVLDVAAVYKTKASLSTLLGNENNKPVDVESIISLTGNMTNPQPSFDIRLPNTDEQTVEQVFMYIDRTNEKVMLEQTASILLTNQFYYSQGGYETNAIQSGVASSVMGVAFSQLSGIISNMVKIVDIDLNYTSAGVGTTSTDQVDANFSKSYGKWTLELNTSFGGSSQTTATDEKTQIIGDASLQYKYNDNLNFEVFNHSNANDFTKYNISPYTQGAKVTYKREYDKISDIFKRKKKKSSK